MLPSVLFVMQRSKDMVVQGEKQLMLKVMWEKLVRRVLRRP